MIGIEAVRYHVLSDADMLNEGEGGEPAPPREEMIMAERARQVTLHLAEDVVTAMEQAIGQGAAADASAFVERALVRALPDVRRKSRRVAWEEASRDPLFISDVAEVEAAFGSADRETARTIV